MKNITLSLLATTVLTAAALPVAAAVPKEPEIYFHPAKAWVVGHAETATDCAVQSEFNNGFVLQFDGSKDGVQSFTVNFRQNIFNEGQSYPVVLTAPGKKSKEFSATATGPSMITVPLQSHNDIYQGARDGAVIDVAMDDNNFRFYLVNFGTAAKKFETCMAGGDMNAVPAAPQPAAIPAPAAPQQPPQREVSASIPQGQTAPPPPRREIETTATLNESIELEQRAQENAAITEIRPEDPQPVISEIPYTETVRLGDQVVMQDGTATPPPSQRPAYRKRMSEQLAEEMANNPSTTARIIGEPAPLAPAPVEAATIEAAPAPEQPKSPAPFVNESRATPPAQEQQPAKIERAEIAPPSTPQEEITQEIARFEEPQEQSQAQALAAQRPAPEPDSFDQASLAPPPGAHPSSTPFSQRGEFIDTDGPKAKQARAPEPAPQEEPAFEPAPPPEPVKETRVEHYETPDIKVTKKTARMEADFTNLDAVEPASQQDDFASSPRRADPEMLMKISELEKKINALQKENNALNSEIQSSVAGAEQERMSIASENWNLERATMRYNEAERQIKRLGEQIQRERALCQSDKKGLEAQLFDPQITEQQQLARLADLEQQLATAEEQLEAQRIRYEDRIRILQSQSATQ